MSTYADKTYVACHSPVHHVTASIYRIVSMVRLGTTQEREKKRITITNNKSETIGIHIPK